MPASSIADSETRSVNSFASSFSQRSFFGKLNKYELKRRFYEKLDDFKNRVLLHKEQGFIVYRARCAYSGGVVVLKGYSRESLTLQTRQRVFSEVSLLQRAQCPFILKCFDSFEDQGWWWLVLENCAAGDLYRIVQQTGPIREEGWLVSQVLLPILQTLAYLHAEGIVHRDIKPEHVLFNSEKVAKLSGFFLSWDVNRYSYPKDMVGTLDYVAPEVFVLNGPSAKQQQVTHYDYKVDIWGVGIMAYDVLVGCPPFNSDEPNATVEAILLKEVEYPDLLSDDAVDFIDQCLTKDPTRRPTARQLLTHPWIRNNLDWEPPEDFDDPIPNIDFSYYRVGGNGDGLDDESEEEEDNGKRWYNPLSWFRRRNSLDDLLSGDPDDGGGGGGGRGGRNASGEPADRAAVRGPWRLTQSLGAIARNVMGNKAQVAPEQLGPGTGGDILDGPGGMGPGGGGGGGHKGFQPGHRVWSREDLEGVPEGEEDADPEGGPHHVPNGAVNRSSPYGHPPPSVPPLPGLGGGGKAGGGGGAAADGDDDRLSSHSHDGSGKPGRAHIAAGGPGGGSGKDFAAAGGGGGDGTALKSPAFLPSAQGSSTSPGNSSSRPASAEAATAGLAVPRRMLPPTAAAHDSAASSEMRCSASGTSRGSPSHAAAIAMPPPPPGLAPEPSDFTAALRALEASAAAAAPAGSPAAAAAAAAKSATSPDGATELLQILPTEALSMEDVDPQPAAAAAAAATTATAAAGSRSRLDRAVPPHLDKAVIQSAVDEGTRAPQASSPWLVPSTNGMEDADPNAGPGAASGSGAAAAAVAGAGQGKVLSPRAAGAEGGGGGSRPGSARAPAVHQGGSGVRGADLAVPGLKLPDAGEGLHPVLPAGSSKTTPREREDTRKLTDGSAGQQGEP